MDKAEVKQITGFLNDAYEGLRLKVNRIRMECFTRVMDNTWLVDG